VKTLVFLYLIDTNNQRGESTLQDITPCTVVQARTEWAKVIYFIDIEIYFKTKVFSNMSIFLQKYGYKLPDVSKLSQLFHLRKDPRQIFYGLEPGWLINLKDQTILKPTDKKFETFYHS
jgi:hypothetical protein